jgi:nucleotide-binding universal stress UspA family protein
VQRLSRFAGKGTFIGFTRKIASAMQRVLVTTDFSAACCHALDYACPLLQGKDIALDLLHIFQVPVNYTSDAVTLATLHQNIDQAEDLLERELARARKAWPDMHMEGRVLTGGFLETLHEEAIRSRPLFIVLGTAGHEVYAADDDPLEALRSLPAPVLFVPQGTRPGSIRKVAYACHYAHAGPRIPAAEICEWLRLIHASLAIIHTSPAPADAADAQALAGKQWLEAAFAPLRPEFVWVQDEDVIHGIAGYVSTHEVDCVLAVPRRHGIWQSLFHSSRTKALARLNKVPVMAFRERDV